MGTIDRRTTKRRDRLDVVGGAVRAVVIADTHSSPHPRSFALVEREKPAFILHAGDIGNLAVLDRFAAIAPVLAVRGNIDVHAAEVPDVVTLDLTEGESTVLTITLTHIAVNGPKLRADALRLAQAEDAQMIICGHSHVPFIGRDRGVSIFNPGSIGPRRFQLPITFGVLQLADHKLTLRHIDCESGAEWSPAPH